MDAQDLKRLLPGLGIAGLLAGSSLSAGCAVSQAPGSGCGGSMQKAPQATSGGTIPAAPQRSYRVSK
jgi:radical SAM modification target selenobiotic family peptide